MSLTVLCIPQYHEQWRRTPCPSSPELPSIGLRVAAGHRAIYPKIYMTYRGQVPPTHAAKRYEAESQTVNRLFPSLHIKWVERYPILSDPSCSILSEVSLSITSNTLSSIFDIGGI